MDIIFANYIHDLSPVIIEFSEKVKLRWYGLAYVAGFLVAYGILLHLSKKKLFVVKPEKVSDLVTFCAFLGVFLGGRIGYVFLYMVPEKGWGYLADDPLTVIRVWDGGMASHGGILGIMLYTLFYAFRHKVSWAGLGDGLTIVAPLGVFFGRVANFINGELYGTTTKDGAWYGVKFPASLVEDDDKLLHALTEASFVNEDVEKLMMQVDREVPSDMNWALNQVIEISREDPEVLEALGNHIELRHASQLYEGFLEGLLIFLVLYWMRVKFPKIANGIITGCFFLIYAGFRILVENVREPDSEKLYGMTKGQFYSTFMIVIGVLFLIWGLVRREKIRQG
ncbi:MAG: prolipoprotein diacylglyceryl transferase [Akkermansiaceae bacterium]